MRLTVRLFAVLREKQAADQIEIELEENASVKELTLALKMQAPAIAPFLPAVRVAVNEVFVDEDAVIPLGADIALIPPVSGGSGLLEPEISSTSIDVETQVSAVREHSAGAVVVFLGTVRNQTDAHQVKALEYEVYDSMAKRKFRELQSEVAKEWPGAQTKIVHREGRVEIGELSVVVAVSHPHRAEAFAACRHVIEGLKSDVPIWKKELRENGEVWMGMGS